MQSARDIRLKTGGRFRIAWFTLVELIVVITILAILATIGFLALSGYSQDAKDATAKANTRSLYTAISSEAAVTNNSPRYYVVHDAAAALTGAAVAYVDGNPVSLTGWDWNVSGTNYSAGNPDWTKLKLNPDKFRVSLFGQWPVAMAAYDAKQVAVGALDASLSATANGKKRAVSYFQVTGVSQTTKTASIAGNFPSPTVSQSASGAVTGLVKNPASTSMTWALVENATVNVVSQSGPCSAKTAGTVCTGGAKYAFAFNAKDYMVTPGGCTDSATPVCAGWADTVKKRWGTYGITTGKTSTTDGAWNTDYLAANYPLDAMAAKFCADMTYGGYNDWFLPAKDELYQLYLNKDQIQGFATVDTPNVYFSSTETNSTMAEVIFIWYMDGAQSINYKWSGNDSYVRCVRKY